MLVITIAIITGVISGMGLGGGVFLVPALALLVASAQHEAQGSTLMAYLPTALVAAITHYRHGNVDLPISWRVAGSGLFGAIVGALLAGILPPMLLRRVFGLFLLVLGIYSVLRPGGDQSK